MPINKEKFSTAKYKFLIINTLILPIFLLILSFLDFGGEAFGVAYVLLIFLSIVPLVLSFLQIHLHEKIASLVITFIFSAIVMLFYLMNGTLENFAELMVMLVFYFLPYTAVFIIGSIIFYSAKFLRKRVKGWKK